MVPNLQAEEPSRKATKARKSAEGSGEDVADLVASVKKRSRAAEEASQKETGQAQPRKRDALQFLDGSSRHAVETASQREKKKKKSKRRKDGD